MDYQPLNKMRYRVDLLQPGTSYDSAGQPTSHQSYATGLWASIEDLQGAALERAQLLSNEVNTRVTIYYDPAVQTGWQVVDDNGVTYRVDYTRDPGMPFRKMFLELLCKRTDGGV